MALPHLQPGQPTDVIPFGAGVVDQKTAALFKSRDLEVIRLVLQAGQSLPPHAVDGDITIQCIEGRLEIALPDDRVVLDANQIIFLDGKQQHGVLALQPSSALVTIALLAKSS